MEEAPPSVFPELLQELEANPEDAEHTSVSVTHESEWCLGAYRDGYIVFENLEEGDPRHMTDIPPDKIITLPQCGVVWFAPISSERKRVRFSECARTTIRALLSTPAS